jgi:Metallo-peptidase family M12B Reprolysin-like
MGKPGLGIGRIAQAVFLWGISSLPATQAIAQVPYYVNVQPIDVCASNGTNCAPVNDGIAQVGFADPNTNQDITRAILNQVGIDVNFLPVQQYFTSDPTLQNLSVTAIPGCVASPTNSCLTSAGLQNLSFQPQISQGASPAANPLGVPLGSDPHTINMFFVNGLTPDPPGSGILYGFSWIGNNGVAVGSNTFGFVTPRGAFDARPDTIAHELGHNLGLDHPTLNPGQPANDLLSMGSIPRTEPSGVGDLTSGNADQLNPMQTTQLVNPDGGPLNPFLIPKAGVDTQVTDPREFDDFSVSFQNAGRPGESLNTLTLTAPAGFRLDPSEFLQLNLPGDTPGITVTLSDPYCTASCTLIFTGDHFVFGDRVDYTIGVCGPGEEGHCSRLAGNQLAGGTYTYFFSDGFQTTSRLQSNGQSILDANSWNPDLTIPTSLDLALFTPFSTSLPCVIQPPATTCPALNLADANPAEEGGQQPAVPVPEPPSIAIILAGLTFWFVLGSRRARRATLSV